MGPLTWTLAGLAAVIAGRAILLFRKHSLVETLVGCVTGFAAGLAATALDFGGWSELSWPASVFAFGCAAAAIALLRLVAALSSAEWPKQ